MLRLFGSLLSAVPLLFASVIVHGLTGSAEAQTELRWKFSPGTEYKGNTESALTIQSEAQGQKIEIAFGQTIDADWKVVSVDDKGTAAIESTFSRIQFSMKNPLTGELTYDSDSPNPPAGFLASLGPVFNAMKGATFTFKLSPRGEVSDAVIPEGVATALKAISQVQMLAPMFSQDTMRQLISAGIHSMPEEPVAAGKTWKNEVNTQDNMQGKIKVLTEYAVEGTETKDGRTLTKIKADSQITRDPVGGAVPLTIKEQSSKGVIYFDSANGLMAESDFTQTIVADVMAGGLTVPTKTEVVLKSKLSRP
jgi:hypothetical protein